MALGTAVDIAVQDDVALAALVHRDGSVIVVNGPCGGGIFIDIDLNAVGLNGRAPRGKQALPRQLRVDVQHEIPVDANGRSGLVVPDAVGAEIIAGCIDPQAIRRNRNAAVAAVFDAGS